MRNLWVLLLCLAPAVFAADMTKLTVQVNAAETDKPVSRASVIVRFRHGFHPIKMKKMTTSWETKTGENGSVTIPLIPQGEVMIQVIAQGRQTFGGIYELKEEEQTVNIKLNAPQAQYSEHEALKKKGQ
jgi:hypothetical protein